jgi:hypothetical protein
LQPQPPQPRYKIYVKENQQQNVKRHYLCVLLKVILEVERVKVRENIKCY